MLEIITLKCANCGGKLEITPEMDEFACGYCGVSQIVQRRGGTISLKKLTDSISKVQVGTDKTAAELAIIRLKEEMSDAKTKHNTLIVHKTNEVNNTTNGFLVGTVLSAGVLTCYCYNISPVLALFVFVIIVGISGFLWHKFDQNIKNKYDPQIKKINGHYNNLEAKLAKQKSIVD